MGDEVDDVGEARKKGLPDVVKRKLILFGRTLDAGERHADGAQELEAAAGAPSLVPAECLGDVGAAVLRW